MTHRERIQAVVSGQPTDRTPIALWRHFPDVDQTAEGLAGAVAGFQEDYDFDLVKVTHTSGYAAEAWGARLESAHNDEGTRLYTRRVITEPGDWARLPRLDVDEGILGRELRCIELVRHAVGADVHVLPTVFSPLTIAKQLAGDAWLEHLRQRPEDLERGLYPISETMAGFAVACLERGADAVFFAAQNARHDLLAESEYVRFGVPFDLAVLNAVRARGALLALHLHGLNPMFDLAARYDADIVNWHDRDTIPALAEGIRRLQRGAAMGGLNRDRTLAGGTPDQVSAEVHDAVRQAAGHRLIVGAGCVSLTNTPPENIRAARMAVASP